MDGHVYRRAAAGEPLGAAEARLHLLRTPQALPCVGRHEDEDWVRSSWLAQEDKKGPPGRMGTNPRPPSRGAGTRSLVPSEALRRALASRLGHAQGEQPEKRSWAFVQRLEGELPAGASVLRREHDSEPWQAVLQDVHEGEGAVALSNEEGVISTPVLVDVIELSRSNPLGQLAFRYKHG